MDKLSYFDPPSSTKNPNLKNTFTIKGLTENGINSYLLNKDSMAYNFLQKPPEICQKSISSKGNNGFFSTAIDVKSTRSMNSMDKEV